MKTIMILGTGPCVGKSLVATAMCRYLSKMNFKVIPLKLLSNTNRLFRTIEGKNIDRSLMIEAIASDKVPRTSMNPLTVTEDEGNYTLRNKGVKIAKNNEISSINFNELFIAELEGLNKEYDYCTIEGCENISEIGFFEKNSLNLISAKKMNASIILVSDMTKDQGFASLIGTFKSMEIEERNLIKGFILNNYNGDKSLLQNKIDEISKSINIKCLGVLPHLHFDFHENFIDSKNFISKNPNAPIDVAILATPHMSSFIDVAPLTIESDVSLRLIRDKREFGSPDLLVIPGSSNTCKDMVYIRELELDKIIIDYSKHGLIIGICGGYQLLGERLIDPDGVESDIKEQDAMGVLKVDTIFQKTAVFNKVRGRIIPLNIEIDGCENHFGISYNKEENKDFVHVSIENENHLSKNEGAYNDSFNVFGTYLHRCFELPYFRQYILNRIREKKSLNKITSKHYDEYFKEEINKISNEFEKNIDYNYILNL